MYATPKLVAYGDATSQILGGCEWGTEDLYLNKDGFYRKTGTRCVSSGDRFTCQVWGECTDGFVGYECYASNDCGPIPPES